MTEKQQQQYIIDDNMLMVWRVGCVDPYDPNPDPNHCASCEYRGKDKRNGCCDFDDDDMQKIFQSNPIKEEYTVEYQIPRISNKLINGLCLPDGDCGKCILCDNAGGCLAESSYQVQQALRNALTLTPTLATHYQQRSQDTGKSMQQLVLADLTALMKKRTVREERRVFKEIEYERL